MDMELKMDTKLNGDDFIPWKWYYFIESTILDIMQSQILWKIVVIIRRFFTWYFYYYYDGWFFDLKLIESNKSDINEEYLHKWCWSPKVKVSLWNI